MRPVVVRLLLTLLLLWPISLGLIDAYGLWDQDQPADAIVILGSKVYPDGRLGPALTRRTRHAVVLYEQGLAPLVICSGGLGQNAPSEAEAACGLAASLGVPASALLREDRAHSTEEDALYTAILLRARAGSSVVVVSDGYHLFRSAMLFRAAGLRPYPSPAQSTQGPMNLFERYGRETREIAALVWYWGKALVGYRSTDFP